MRWSYFKPVACKTTGNGLLLSTKIEPTKIKKIYNIYIFFVVVVVLHHYELYRMGLFCFGEQLLCLICMHDYHHTAHRDDILILTNWFFCWLCHSTNIFSTSYPLSLLFCLSTLVSQQVSHLLRWLSISHPNTNFSCGIMTAWGCSTKNENILI